MSLYNWNEDGITIMCDCQQPNCFYCGYPQGELSLYELLDITKLVPMSDITQVIAKLTCNNTGPDYEGSENIGLQMNAVIGYDENGKLLQNTDFSDSTPSADLNMLIEKNRPAALFFKEGRDYYLTFTEVPKDEASNPYAYEEKASDEEA